MNNDSTNRTDGVVLVGRKDNEYWFIDSVFRHRDDFYGCTGTTVCPISADQVEYDTDPENMGDRYSDYWAEQYKDSIRLDCGNCAFGIDDGGCKHCDYPSLTDFCAGIVQYEGYDAVYDYPGHAYEKALNDLLDDVETVDTSGCGRIFSRLDIDDFDEVYNRKALVACLAYEDGAVDYDYACRVIFGK